ncbi:hypothetical protein PAL_GLEAN10017664 [Pteropus alecto]|uniref:Uncharacterized protein n=1 Tax=Pteropus alecto TaxID=9402 RepID=L5KZE9_PTEAL|nr:hypothetical protein PAL_GLEAN10017664 [Pteropus alecto]
MGHVALCSVPPHLGTCTVGSHRDSSALLVTRLSKTPRHGLVPRILICLSALAGAHVSTDSAGRSIFLVFKEKKNVPVSVEMICSSARLKLSE